MHIWPPIKAWVQYLWSFSFGFMFDITFDLFVSTHLILRLMPEIFYISFWWVSLWLFGHHILLIFWSLSLFPSQILVCVTAFATQYLFSFGDLHLVSSLSKNNKSKIKTDTMHIKKCKMHKMHEDMAFNAWRVQQRSKELDQGPKKQKLNHRNPSLSKRNNCLEWVSQEKWDEGWKNENQRCT